MSHWADAGWVVLGLGLLVIGGEALVRGASGVALLARVTPAVVGLTVVAAGTSMPELVVSVQAALAGSPGLSAGNVVGSNIFNIAAIVGLTALVHPLRIRGNTVRLEWPVMMLSAVLLYLLSRDLRIDRVEGSGLVACLVAFISYAVWLGQGVSREEETTEDLVTASMGRSGASAWALNGAAIALGVLALSMGSTALVRGAKGAAASLGVSDALIGLTVVAAGTSLPELVTSLVAARRGRDDIAVGNVVGSNIFNALGILGVTAVITPLPVPDEIIGRDDLWMLALSALLFPLMRSGMRVNRFEGAALVILFVIYMGQLVSGAR